MTKAALDRTSIIDHLVILGKVFDALGQDLPWPGYECGLSEHEYDALRSKLPSITIHNPWFTEDNVKNALGAWAKELTSEKLNSWTNRYSYSAKSKNIGVVMAGNIPMVGFHDMISVLLSGHRIQAKLSSSDTLMIQMIADVLAQLDDTYRDLVTFASGPLKGQDAVIATGSNNTARYFEYYFKEVPHIIRKNRNGVAILYGNETEDQLKALGDDIFSYFGLGCRNVSKIYVPSDYNLDTLFAALYEFHPIVNHHKYANNFDYYRSIYLLNSDKILENGFLLMKEDKAIASPVATLHYERYDDPLSLNEGLEAHREEIQCIISKDHIQFGNSQFPSLTDYADGVDTMAFLEGL